ncbi:MAG: hypothetical protein BWK73_21220 [Thiothrix lacustris]|uniref:Uncharacterized protein n=1 Tax=Thiothrix lacustris TaxID=525917 RepID=A0A1Y1QNJ0_9GAMM|nr:MAG: hypothetical protein BWK73_21220 [Thiothrix lacustris]
MKLKVIIPAVMASMLMFSSNAHAIDVAALLAAAFESPSKATTNPVQQQVQASIAATGASQNAAAVTKANNVAAAVTTANAAAVAAGKAPVFVLPAPVAEPSKGAASVIDNFIAKQPTVLAAVQAAVPGIVITPVKPVSLK